MKSLINEINHNFIFGGFRSNLCLPFETIISKSRDFYIYAICIFIFIIFAASGCTKSLDPIDENQYGSTGYSDAFLKTGWSINEPLMPSGNSTTDTRNLQDALQDERFDIGGTLFLGPGTFLIHARA